MNIADSIVNTYAWINATNNSRKYMNTENAIDTTDTPAPTAKPIRPANMNINDINTKIIMCPAKIFAKRRIISAIGLVNVPIISISGINGSGALRNTGTSGQKISL